MMPASPPGKELEGIITRRRCQLSLMLHSVNSVSLKAADLLSLK